MGKLLDRLTGTKHPEAGMPPRPPEDVHAALCALNGPDKPYLVRDGRPEGVDLVAELKIEDMYWLGVFSAQLVTTQFRIRMRLDPERHEVRSSDEEWELVRGAGTSPGIGFEDGKISLGFGRSFQRGQVRSTRKVWTPGEGGLRENPDLGFSSQAVKAALRERVLSTGWGWRGVVFGL